MNTEKKNNSSRLMLTEIIVAVLFFSIISAISLQLFVKSHTLEKRASFNRNAVNIVNSICSMLDGIVKSDMDISEIADMAKVYYSNAEYTDGSIIIYLNNDNKPANNIKYADTKIYISQLGSENNVMKYLVGCCSVKNSSLSYEVEYLIYVNSDTGR